MEGGVEERLYSIISYTCSLSNQPYAVSTPQILSDSDQEAHLLAHAPQMPKETVAPSMTMPR